MINKKFTELFMRKEGTKKEQHKQPVYFDQNFFHCRLISRGINTELIRLQSQVKQNGQPLDEIKCKWFIKNTHDFKEIQDVTSEYYQPCLDDVGSIICVQIEPFIEGKKYNGITIMKQSETIEIDIKLQEDLNKFLERKQLKFDGRLEAVFSQNEKYEAFEMPSQIKLQIIENEIHCFQNGEQFQLIKINSEYPNIEFIRKSFNSIILNFNDHESYKLSFNNNFQRDLFTLITRTLSAHFTEINPEKESEAVIEPEVKTLIQTQNSQIVHDEPVESSKNEEIIEKLESVQKSSQKITSNEKIQIKSESKSFQPKSSQKLEVTNELQATKQKIEEPKQNSTHLILKLDEQNKELKLFKRQLDELRSKKNLQSENEEQKKIISELKKKLEQSQNLNKKLGQVNEDNRFYKNEIAIIRKELKVSKQKIKDLQAKIENKNTQELNEQSKNTKLLTEQYNTLMLQKQDIVKKKENMESQLQKMKLEYQKIQNQNLFLRKKLESLQSQRQLPLPKSSQQKSKASTQAEQRVAELQMKLKNLEMLLRYKSNQGDPSSNFQLLVNKLTQTISEKQLQLNEFKKINKNLLQQLKQLRQRSQ